MPFGPTSAGANDDTGVLGSRFCGRCRNMGVGALLVELRETVMIDSTWQEYETKARALRDNPMVRAWIAAYQADKWDTHKDCRQCSYPHSPYTLCGRGSSFGKLRIGRDWYYIDFSNVVFFHDFMLKIAEGRGFHWRDETFFTRTDDGAVEVHYYEEYNNHPQARMWRIPPNEWASIVASVSKGGETSESYREAQKFHAGDQS